MVRRAGTVAGRNGTRSSGIGERTVRIPGGKRRNFGGVAFIGICKDRSP